MLILAEFGSGQVLWSIFWLFLFIIWFWLLIAIFGDLFRDPDESGWGKALWSLFLIALPYLGILVYMIVRGHGMTERTLAAQKAAQRDFDAAVRQASGSGGAAEEIAAAKKLLDEGAISEDEYERLKARALS